MDLPNYFRDFGLVGLTIGGTSIVFKFLLDSFKSHIERLHDMWRTEADRMYQMVQNVHNDLSHHNQIQDSKLESLGDDVSEVRDIVNKYFTDRYVTTL